MAVWRVTLVYEDSKGLDSWTEFFVAETVVIEDVREYVREIATIVDQLTGCRILKTNIAFADYFDGLDIKQVPDADSDVEEGGHLQFSGAQKWELGHFRIAGFKEANVLPGSDVIDLTATDVDALIDALIVGLDINGTNVALVDSRGADLINVRYGKEKWRRRKFKGK